MVKDKFGINYNMIKVGLFGGTFDPIHNGHLQLALAALEQCDLDKIIFIPAGCPPHKRFSKVTPFHDRYEMVNLVCNKYPNFENLDIENHLNYPSYSVDTVEQLISENPHYELFFIIGDDAFIEIESWKGYKKLLSSVSFILCRRMMFDDKLTNDLLVGLGYVSEEGKWIHHSYKSIYRLDFLPPKISSTMIRENGTGDVHVSNLITNDVRKYIKENKLYCL